jgi:hypothetical protein
MRQTYGSQKVQVESAVQSNGRSEKRLNLPGQATNYETKATVIQKEPRRPEQESAENLWQAEGAIGKCGTVTGRSEKRLNLPGQETNYETKATVIQLLPATITAAIFDSSV